ncbi:hypothetical protein [Corynebacterium sp. HS2168-gen11]|uniref:hypothetical protein n=1 Tax=Corynebacterium sp. HS2168-gen11 TaxID=2974027 RepID=UPI00216AB429|nr:hypothetical protein [Corynebacterium sp. HS2168-gen11]MCS4534815.1 hypothetical protein [Corynebacterium sp. HS2168-gen11]
MKQTHILRDLRATASVILVILAVIFGPISLAHLLGDSPVATTHADQNTNELETTLEEVEHPKITTIDGDTIVWEAQGCTRELADDPSHTIFKCDDTTIDARDIDYLTDLKLASFRATRAFLFSNEVTDNGMLIASTAGSHPHMFVSDVQDLGTCDDISGCSVTQTIIVLDPSIPLTDNIPATDEDVFGIAMSVRRKFEDSDNYDAEVAQLQQVTTTITDTLSFEKHPAGDDAS